MTAVATMKIRIRTLLLVAVTVPAGFVLKYYSGPGHAWFNDYGAAVLYEISWCLAAFLVWPCRRNALPIAAGVLGITCALEFLQLCDAAILRSIRRTLVGQWLIGTTFVWWDFPHYVLGSALGWIAMRLLSRSMRRDVAFRNS